MVNIDEDKDEHYVDESFNNQVEGMVSCIIPTYKRSDTIVRSVKSALNQSYKNVEVIVVDDNDPNDTFSLKTQEKLKDIIDPRFRFIQQDRHINGSVARNYGIKKSNGEYIAFLDDDDEWDTTKIEKQINYLKNNKVDGVTCYYKLYKNGECVRRCNEFSDEDLMFKILSRKVQLMAGSTFLCKKTSIIKSGMFDATFLRHQDLQMLIDFLAVGKIKVCADYLVKLNGDCTKNRPTTENFIEVKDKFLNYIEQKISILSKQKQKRIYAANNFEIVVSALKERKIYIAVKYLCKIGINIYAYIDVFERFKERNQ